MMETCIGCRYQKSLRIKIMKEYSLYNDDPVIRTFTGIWVNCFNANKEMICIDDIAHALSNQCRFGGHLPKFYSVAEHSIRCSILAGKESKLAALLHDASEAYLVDIPRPIKLKLDNYKTIEDSLMKIIAEKYGFNYPLSAEVRNIDEIMLQKEWESLMLRNNREIIPLTKKTAEKLFLKTFYGLINY